MPYLTERGLEQREIETDRERARKIERERLTEASAARLDA